MAPQEHELQASESHDRESQDGESPDRESQALVSMLRRQVQELPTACETSRAATQARVDQILRPAGAMARLDELAVWLAGWQRTARPVVERPAALIFAGDHGVTADGVSAYPAEVTGAMLEAFRQGRASISAMAGVAGATVEAVDVGVGKPTANIRIEPAMARERFVECFEIGRQRVALLDSDLLIVGEMGIGNTTAAAAVCSLLLQRPAAEMVGAGTGVADEALHNKVTVVDQAVARARATGVDTRQPLEVLRQLGGTELVAMAGAMFEARSRSMAVLLDGYITSSAALALHLFDTELTTNIRAGHGSAEPGHQQVLQAMELRPLLDLDFRLGEASGAMAALPLLTMACRLVNDVPTFDEWFGTTPQADQSRDQEAG